MNLHLPSRRIIKPYTAWEGSPLVTRIIESPNVSERPTARHPSPVIDTVILHATGGNDLDHALEILTNPDRQVSSHYLIDREGNIIQLVDERMKAWHAGTSYWAGYEPSATDLARDQRFDINPRSIGVELLSDGHSYTEPEYVGLEMLLADIMARRPQVVAERVLGHHEVAFPIGRKWDPHGNMGMDWARLKAKGLTTDHCRVLPFTHGRAA